MVQKVVFFTTGMTAGGAERIIATLSNALVGHGFEVVIAMIKGDRSEYPLAGAVKLRSGNLEPGIHNLPRAIAFYRKAMRDENPDVIVSFSTKSDIIALLSRILYRVKGRLIVSDRADPYTRDKWMQMACNYLYRFSDALVCQSQNVADYYHARCSSAAISVIANPLNPECIGEPTAERRDPMVISVGRLSDQKNHRLAIESFKEVLQTFPNLTLKIFGSGPLESELEEYILSENLQGRVLLEGILPNVIRENERAALFLFTSSYEGYPNALLEAAATGIPTVTTDFSPGTAVEIIDDKVNGYIVPIGDKIAIVEASIKALNGELCPEDLAAASLQVRERHGAEHILKAWVRVFGRGDAADISS